jgi:hypothetical protein
MKLIRYPVTPIERSVTIRKARAADRVGSRK